MSLKTCLQSISLIFACGTALFSHGYANGVIGNVNTLLIRIYGEDIVLRHNYNTAVNSATLAGTVVGMFTFGYVSDKISRKFGMMIAAAIVALFSGLSAASVEMHGGVASMLVMLIIMRFLLGIGIGAEYPCGSVSASERSEEAGVAKKARHRWFALATNMMAILGLIASSFVPLVLLWIFGNNHLRVVWRLSLGLGVVPALAIFIWRLGMDESARFKKDSMKHAPIPYRLIFHRYGSTLAAMTIVSFIYNFITYPFGIYSSMILNNITGGSVDLAVIFGWNVVILLFFFPGSFIGAFVLDYLGPKRTMTVGLLVQALIGFIMSSLYARLAQHIAAFAVMYGIFASFGEFGAGNCAGLLTSKSMPTAVRGQFYGAVAGIGKIGALIGIWSFPPLIKAFGGPDSLRGNTGPFWVASALVIVSAAVTLFFVKPLDKDGMDKEDAAFRVYLETNGYDTRQMGMKAESGLSSVAAEKITTGAEAAPAETA